MYFSILMLHVEREKVCKEFRAFLFIVLDVQLFVRKYRQIFVKLVFEFIMEKLS